jgi:tRNA-splicing ligase RtcB (3'-phosphate/5'-hydroxy nucleic acid ligase)
MSPTQINPKLLSWAPDCDPNALEQAERASRMPFVAGHVALMPDAHFGMGATVGSVIPTLGAIIPAAVGVDIGCGMIATQLKYTHDYQTLSSIDLPDNLDALHNGITKAIPAGVGEGHAKGVDLTPHHHTAAWEKWGDGLIDTASKQLGSLGSGNHFVEVCLDEHDNVWLVLHSGSRGVGNKLATVHINIAKGLMKEWFINLEDPDLAYLVQGTPEFDDYISDMLWAQDYAMMNRQKMLNAAISAVGLFLGQEVSAVGTINCHHNFTQQEHHGNKDLWITRKGAIKANKGDRGVIPGSMGTRSYIVSGLGNDASFHSCSHGAGRRLARKRATRELTYESLEKAMEGKTWNHSKDLLDEHPLAYKDIDEVMANQADLVKIEATLHQILNYKGT